MSAPTAAVALPSEATIEKVADAHGKSEAAIRKILSDKTAKVDKEKSRIFYVDPAPATGQPAAPVEEAPYPYEQTFQLHSRPGSNRVIYLDFDGETITGTGWNGYLGAPASFYAEPFSIDGTLDAFSTAEQDAIQSVWQRVAEDYAPFDVDVTTQDPGLAAIQRSGAGDSQFGTRVLISDMTEIANNCGCGGVAYLGVFSEPNFHSFYQPALVFPPNLSNNAKYMAEAASHEAGHNFDLRHDGTASLGYYEGHGAWAPIMGVGYYRPVVQWSKGEYSGANNAGQDDLATIVANGAPALADDVGNTTAGALDQGTGPSMSFSGIITTDADVDVFKIQAGVGASSFAVTPAPNSPNLDARLKLLDGGGNTIASNDPLVSMVSFDIASGLTGSLAVNIPAAGTYYLVVDGAGAGSSATTGYSGYGSLGRYTLNGTFTTFEVDLVAPSVTGVSPLDEATEVVVGQNVVITFSEAMTKAAAEGAFSLQKTGSGTPVGGSFTWNGASTQMTFDPTASLEEGSDYDVAVGTGATDLAGNALATAFASNFDTTDPPPPDEVAPTVTGVSPLDEATEVVVGQNVVVTFSEAMDESAAEGAFSLQKTGSGTPVGGSFTWSEGSTQMTFDPTGSLDEGSVYDVAVGTGATDVAGNALGAAFGSNFDTTDPPPPDEVAPTVTGVSPADSATEVATGQNVVVTFSEAMNESAAEGAFALQESGSSTPLGGSFAWNGDSTQMTFDPSASLDEGSTYDVAVGTGATDLAGNALGSAFASSFNTTEPPPPDEPWVTDVSPLDDATQVAAGENVVVTFSEPMNLSATKSAFALRKAGTTSKLSGAYTWNSAGTQLTFNPSANLLANTEYEVVITTAAKDLAGNLMVSPFGSDFRTDSTAPSVTDVSPLDDATQIAANENVVITFSEAMNRSATQSAFSVKKAGTTSKLSGAYTWNSAGTQLTFNPSANLLANTEYNVAVTTAAKDLAGNLVAPAFGSDFRTDSTAPSVTDVSPLDNATGVPAGDNVVVTFAEPMNMSATKSAFALRKAGTTSKLSGAYTWNSAGTQLTFNPSANLLANTEYEVVITTAAKDLAGNLMMSPFGSDFRTDSTAPSVADVSPLDDAIEVAVGENVVMTFSEAMNRSVTQSAFALKKAGTTSKLSGAYTWNAAGTEMTFNPGSNLLANTDYDIAVTTAAKDLAGNLMTSPFASSLTTLVSGSSLMASPFGSDTGATVGTFESMTAGAG